MKSFVLSSVLLHIAFSEELTCYTPGSFFDQSVTDYPFGQCTLDNSTITSDLIINKIGRNLEKISTRILPNTLLSLYKSPSEIISFPRPPSFTSKESKQDEDNSVKMRGDEIHTIVPDILNFPEDPLSYHSTTHYFARGIGQSLFTICTPLQCISYKNHSKISYTICHPSSDSNQRCTCDSPLPLGYSSLRQRSIAVCITSEEFRSTLDSRHRLLYFSLFPLSPIAYYHHTTNDTSPPLNSINFQNYDIPKVSDDYNRVYVYNLSDMIGKNGIQFSVSHNLFPTTQLSDSDFAVRTESKLYLLKRGEEGALALSEVEEPTWMAEREVVKGEVKEKEQVEGRRIVIQTYSDSRLSLFDLNMEKAIAYGGLKGRKSDDFSGNREVIALRDLIYERQFYRKEAKSEETTLNYHFKWMQESLLNFSGNYNRMLDVYKKYLKNELKHRCEKKIRSLLREEREESKEDKEEGKEITELDEEEKNRRVVEENDRERRAYETLEKYWQSEKDNIHETFVERVEKVSKGQTEVPVCNIQSFATREVRNVKVEKDWIVKVYVAWKKHWKEERLLYSGLTYKLNKAHQLEIEKQQGEERKRAQEKAEEEQRALEEEENKRQEEQRALEERNQQEKKISEEEQKRLEEQNTPVPSDEDNEGGMKGKDQAEPNVEEKRQQQQNVNNNSTPLIIDGAEETKGDKEKGSENVTNDEKEAQQKEEEEKKKREQRKRQIIIGGSCAAGVVIIAIMAVVYLKRKSAQKELKEELLRENGETRFV